MSERVVSALLLFAGPVALYLGILYLQFRKRRLTNRLPITSTPRPPGWSLQTKISELEENQSIYVTLLVASGGLAGFLRFLGLPLTPSIIICAVGATIGIAQLYRLMPTYSNYKLGLMGEQAVGAILNTLSHETIQVFHDYQIKETGRKPWNIDHIVVSPEGVFLIETKTRRKLRGKSNSGQDGHRVKFDGKLLHFPFGVDHYGLKQAKRSAEWLSKELSSSVGEHIPVKPLLALPGWMVERNGRGEVHVMNEKELLGYFKRPKQVIIPTLQKRITHQLERHCIVDLSK